MSTAKPRGPDGRWLPAPKVEPPNDGQERDLQGLTQAEAVQYPFSDPEKAKAAGLLGPVGRKNLTKAKRLVMEIATGAYQEALRVALEEFRTLLWMRDNMTAGRFGVRNRKRLWDLCAMILKHTEKVLPASLEVSGHLTVAEVPLLPDDIIKALIARWEMLQAAKKEKQEQLKALPSAVEQGEVGHETEESPAAQSRQLKSAGQSPADD